MTERRHGRSGTANPTYICWANMRKRCLSRTHVQYRNYGGRGISICERWSDFNAFLADMGEKPAGLSLDRFPDNDGNYEPGNCRWATAQEQARNRRRSIVITAHGRTQTLGEWAKELGVPLETFESRIHRGWTGERIVTVPIKVKNKKRRRR